MRPSLLRLALAPIALIVLAGCQSAGATDVSTGSDPGTSRQVTVEIDVMSGVPNPSWTLSDDESDQLSDLVAALAQGGKGRVPADPGLGFRGFILRGLDLSSFGAYDQLKVLGTQIIASAGTSRGVILQDPDKSVYAMIRTMSEHQVAAPIFEQIPVDGVRGA